ncbi:hypothetical protein [Dyella flagellata]|uniref:Membrane protein n=1 Tax=Dyella flagellata TaxID=1867833 RepID=A0ABQ5XBM6_9GAMM|nr:hypothetical protein [Dyella flagellata]GLQ89096.1 membrane protein [Dyella flagellata]
MTWLQKFYFLRSGGAAVWVALVLVTAPASVGLATALLVIYPAWDALANWLDAQRSGGMQLNPGQTFNLIVSAVTAVCMGIAVPLHGNAGGVLVFGSWALLAGIFQLIVGIARRKLGGQVFMMISGAQSALAGIVFIYQSLRVAPGLVQLTGYAAFGGFYFLASALWLTFKKRSAARAMS